MEKSTSVVESESTGTTPSADGTETTTSFPEVDDFLIVPMATVAGIVVFIILLTAVCFFVKTKRRARANVRRMLKNRARPMSQLGSLQIQSRPVSLVGSYQNQSRPDSQMGSLGHSPPLQTVLREVHQPLYGPAAFTAEVIWSNPPLQRQDSPDYENSPAPVLDPPRRQSDQTKAVTRQTSDYVDTSGYKEDLSAIQKKDQENCDMPQDDIGTESSEKPVNVNVELPKVSVTDRDIRKVKRKVKSKHSNRKKHSVKTLVTVTKHNSGEDTADVCMTGVGEANAFELPPPTPCAKGPKYANIDPDNAEDNVFEKVCVDSKSFGYVNARDVLDHSYINITKAIAFGKRGYSTSVLPRLEENKSRKDHDYENAYMPMDMIGSPSAIAEDMYIPMNKTNAAYTESSTLPLHVYVNTDTNDEDVYISPSVNQYNAPEWGRNKRYMNCPRSKSIDEVYSIAKSEHDFKRKY